MPAVGQTQFYKSCVLIGGVPFPAYPGVRLMMPLNYAVPPIIGNYWQWNYGEGLQQPMMEVQLCVRDKAAEAFALSMFAHFMTRTTDVANDTSVVSSGVSFWNGQRGFTLNGAKADSFTIGCGSGDDIRFTLRFVGTSLTPIGSAPTFTGWDSSNLLRFSKCTFASPFDSAVWNFNLSFSNNSNPDLSLNGTANPTAQNAGMQTAGFSCLMQAASTPTALALGNGTFPSPVTPTQIVLTVAGANVTRVFTLNNPVITNPNDIAAQAPRNMQEYQFLALGSDGITNPPLVVT